MEAGISLKIMSPEQVLEECQVSKVKLPGKKDPFVVLKNHASLISALDTGTIEYVTADGETRKLQVKSGFVEVKDNKVSVCVEL